MPSPFPGMDPFLDHPDDLQAVFRRTYDAAAYQRWIRYRAMDIVPPLPEKWRKWAADVVATVPAE